MNVSLLLCFLYVFFLPSLVHAVVVVAHFASFLFSADHFVCGITIFITFSLSSTDIGNVFFFCVHFLSPCLARISDFVIHLCFCEVQRCVRLQLDRPKCFNTMCCILHSAYRCELFVKMFPHATTIEKNLH